MRARVFVTLKPSVFDPQGTTVAEALHTLGYAAVKDVRQGKYFELDIDAATTGEATRLASEAAEGAAVPVQVGVRPVFSAGCANAADRAWRGSRR